MSGKGHPLPRSDEARHNEIPEHLEEEKGCGDDAKAAIQPDGEAVGPDGEPYRYGISAAARAPDRRQMRWRRIRRRIRIAARASPGKRPIAASRLPASAHRGRNGTVRPLV